MVAFASVVALRPREVKNLYLKYRTVGPHDQNNNHMELHIYRENSRDRVVKDSSKSTTLYFVSSPTKLFSVPPKQVYRGESGDPIATITREGSCNFRYVVTLHPSEEVITINHPSFFSSKSKFVYGGKEFAWKADKELIDLNSGDVIASFDRSHFAIKKKGVMTVLVSGMEMLDVVVMTGIAMQYRWERTRQQQRNAAASGGGP